jgi:hypothetical protein
MYKGVLWYNELSDNTKKEMNLLKFKKECIKHVKRNYDVHSIVKYYENYSQEMKKKKKNVIKD